MTKSVIVPKVKAELQIDRGKLHEQSKEIAKSLWSGQLTVNEQAAINHICLMYGLDPLLKQVVCLGGNIYITGGGLRVIANRDKEQGVDGIEIAPATKEERAAYGIVEVSSPVDEDYQHLFKIILWKKGCAHPFIEWGEATMKDVRLYSVNFKSLADMAKTRGVNRAIRNAYAIAFTSLEEMGYVEGDKDIINITTPIPQTEETDQDVPFRGAFRASNAATTQPRQSPSSQQQQEHSHVNSGAARRIYAIAATRNWQKEDVKSYIKEFFDVESTKDLTPQQADMIFNYIKDNPK